MMRGSILDYLLYYVDYLLTTQTEREASFLEAGHATMRGASLSPSQREGGREGEREIERTDRQTDRQTVL
jgi:hypothetical protein